MARRKKREPTDEDLGVGKSRRMLEEERFGLTLDLRRDPRMGRRVRGRRRRTRELVRRRR